MLGVGAPFDVAAPRMVNEDPAHRLGRDRKEMRAVLPVHALVIDQPHVGFVDQRRCLKAVAGALAFHVAARQAAELLVHNRRQLGERALVPVAPGTEKHADVAWNRSTNALASMHCPDRPIIRGLLHSFA